MSNADKAWGDEIFYIAEVGVNHNGSLDRAKEMVDIADNAGADGVKFQSFVAEASVRKDEAKAKYQEENTNDKKSQYEMLKKYELSYEDHLELLEYCSNKEVEFITTVSSEDSIELIRDLDISIIKIGSSDVTNHPLLKSAASLNTPLIVSTGMAYMEEVTEAFEVIRDQNSEIDLAFLHCVSDYPADPDSLNLRSIRTMDNNIPGVIGFSDHTMMPETPAIAVGAGAKIIEKHFTLDRSLEGPDHDASLEPDELRKSIEQVRLANKMLGDSAKCPTEKERKNKLEIRRSIHAASDLKAGDILSQDNIRICRPADGISPKQFDEIIGATIQQHIKKDQPIKTTQIK